MMKRFAVVVLIAGVGASMRAEPPPGPPNSVAWRNTFSFVAYDPARTEWGVGTASKVLAVGAGLADHGGARSGRGGRRGQARQAVRRNPGRPRQGRLPRPG